MKKLLLTVVIFFAFSSQIFAQACPTNLLTNSTFSPGLAGWSQYGTVNSPNVLSGTSGCLNNYYILQPSNNSNTGIKQPVTFKKDSCYNLCYCYEIPNSGGGSSQLIFAAITPGVTVAQLVAGTFTPAQAQIISQVNATSSVAVNYNCLTTITASGNFTDFVVVNQTVGSVGSDIFVDNICLKRDTCQLNCNTSNLNAAFTYTASGTTANFTNGTTATGPYTFSYTWDFGDPPSGVNNTSTLTNPSHTYPGPGTYTACVYATAIDPNTIPVCNDTFCYDILIASTGINDIAINSMIQLMPNPANDFVTIKSLVPVTGIQLYNSVGQMVHTEKLQGTTFAIPMHLPVGVYSLVLNTPKGQAYKKLLISR